MREGGGVEEKAKVDVARGRGGGVVWWKRRGRLDLERGKSWKEWDGERRLSDGARGSEEQLWYYKHDSRSSNNMNVCVWEKGGLLLAFTLPASH